MKDLVLSWQPDDEDDENSLSEKLNESCNDIKSLIELVDDSSSGVESVGSIIDPDNQVEDIFEDTKVLIDEDSWLEND